MMPEQLPWQQLWDAIEPRFESIRAEVRLAYPTAQVQLDVHCQAPLEVRFVPVERSRMSFRWWFGASLLVAQKLRLATSVFVAAHSDGEQLLLTTYVTDGKGACLEYGPSASESLAAGPDALRALLTGWMPALDAFLARVAPLVIGDMAVSPPLLDDDL